MVLSEDEDECKKVMLQNMDVYQKLELLIKERNRTVCRKELKLPRALSEDSDLVDILSNDDGPIVKQNKRLQSREKAITDLIDEIHKMKKSSESDMNFPIDTVNNQFDEVNQAISRLRQQSEKVFKRIINTQVSFNEFLGTTCLSQSSGNKDLIKSHLKVIEKTCKYDRGVEAITRFNKETLVNHVDENIQVKTVEEFKNEYNKLAQGVLSNAFETASKSAKNHEHLLAIKKYNKPNLDCSNIVSEVVTTGVLDPFTRQPITRPVRNRICNHIYDQDSVNQMFLTRSVVPCPYIGCTNKHFTRKDLLEYEEPNLHDSL
ncbi:E3 SUMO-protein ligase NSE2-like [Daktulosphaira vitifoliae]|uniref:E3 SUMO-protein ligase NSE2-like n=1 Tax=Daktulosphaira vitifoliae TaxID=58002 RepID=UPI0021AAB0AD|nr:E3 SUMO-protein ligase NSE2-like [Daktulosphaira vitifoliae]XP_050548967.1 E3 SUMO-protein ligase NSE2-like [Daktulosphaira vitifoliae]XP_050548968.1 E3 SUMO-protein ligase NSE2-like [Daktulosphaira vitifoliae]